MIRDITIFLKSIKIFVKTKSMKRAIFYYKEMNNELTSLDDELLLAELCYFGHHTEKALKHHNRGNRGIDKRNKLELIINEVERRKINEYNVINWAKHLINYFDTNKDIYVEVIKTIDFKQNQSEQYINFIKERTTTRFWKDTVVSDSVIENIIETAMSASLSCNRQTIRFIVVKNKQDNVQLGDSNNMSMFKKAPLLIYVADDERFFGEKYGNALDVGAVCATLQLAAHAFELASTWMYYADYYDQNKIRRELNIDKNLFVYSVLALGFPYDKQEKPPRFNVDRFIINRSGNE